VTIPSGAPEIDGKGDRVREAAEDVHDALADAVYLRHGARARTDDERAPPVDRGGNACRPARHGDMGDRAAAWERDHQQRSPRR
jgi:hypothetical protein